jgi:hypothetical protein
MNQSALPQIANISVGAMARGMVFLGPDDWHITVERVKPAARTVLVEGRNGFGEAFSRRYKADAIVRYFVGQRSPVY